MGFIGYFVLDATASKPREDWVWYSLADGWTVAYRVSYTGEGARRRARVHEVRIVPEADHFNGPKQNYVVYEQMLADRGRRIPPFSFEAVRRRVTPKMLSHVLHAYATTPGLAGTDAPGFRAAKLAKPRRGGRPTRPLRFYARFAVAYERVENNDRREPGTSTRAILARRYDVPPTTVAKWIKVARERGLLTRVRRGERGGMATEHARQLLTREKA